MADPTREEIEAATRRFKEEGGEIVTQTEEVHVDGLLPGGKGQTRYHHNPVGAGVNAGDVTRDRNRLYGHRKIDKRRKNGVEPSSYARYFTSVATDKSVKKKQMHTKIKKASRLKRLTTPEW